jgi:hypothetical protein
MYAYFNLTIVTIYTIKVKVTLEQWRTQEFFRGGEGRGSTNSVEDRGQRELGSGGR